MTLFTSLLTFNKFLKNFNQSFQNQNYYRISILTKPAFYFVFHTFIFKAKYLQINVRKRNILQ